MKFGNRPSTFAYKCAWISEGRKNYFKKFYKAINILRKSVLGYIEGYSKKIKKFCDRPRTFQENCTWLSRGYFYIDHVLFKKSVLG